MSEFDVKSSSSTTKLIEAVVVSEFITAPAASTLVASVTSAPDSIPSSFVPSAATSRPSTSPLTVMSPVTLTPPDAVASLEALS